MNELITLTKRYLQEEYNSNDWVWTDKATCDFFRERALQSPKKAAPPKFAPPATSKPQAQTPLPTRKRRSAPPMQAGPTPNLPKEPPKRTEIATQKTGRDFMEVRQILSETAPKLKVVDKVPSDAKAKKVASAWKNSVPEVAIIAITPTKTELELLEKIASAIEGLGSTAKVLIGEQQWERLFKTDHLKLVLVPEQTLKSHKEFQDIKTVKVCPLKPIQTYIDQPNEKAVLWKEIRQQLS